MPLIYISCCWIIGIFLGARFNLSPVLIVFGLIPLTLLILNRQNKKLIILTCLCLIALFTGAWRYQSSLPIDSDGLHFFNDQGTVKIKGIISSDPEIREKITRLYLSANEIEINGERQKVSGTALLFVPRYLDYGYGDVLIIKGELNTPAQFSDFDYQGYLAGQGIFSTMYYPEIEVTETGKGSSPLSWVYSVRNNLSRVMAEVLPEPQASLAQGIILGIKGNISSSVKDGFARTGTAHLLAISGVHLSIVAGILLSLGLWFFGKKRYLYIWLALGGIWLYAMLTGLHAPVVRAAIMVSFFLAAELLGRQRSAIVALAFAAALMVGVNPQSLWDASFQMSFMAMAGLIFVFPPIQALGRKIVSDRLGDEGMIVSIAHFTVDSLSVSLGAVIAVWPLVSYYFGTASWIGPLATFFVLPALPVIIIFGIASGVMGLLFIPAAQIIAWVAWLFLSYMLLVVQAFTSISPVEGNPINPAAIWIYYALMALVIWLIGKLRKPGEVKHQVASFVSGLSLKWFIPPLVVIAILVWLAAATMPDNNLRISFLDVGQGDAILVQKGNRQILIDGGPSPQKIGLELGGKMPFWDRTIEMVILTHPNADHITGLIEVLNRYKVEQVLYPDSEHESPLYDEWLSLIEEKEIKSTLARAGQRIEMGTVIIEILNPQIPLLTGTDSDIDNNSVVLRLETGKVSFLFTADIMPEAEFKLITRRANLTTTVLKVAHHGSATSTTAEFLSVVNPQFAVISVGEGNRYGHPDREIIVRLEEKTGQKNLYRTDTSGTIDLITDGERLWLKTEK